ncbi:MAG TPA: ester cyclase [Thermomicrobiales bacterium]|nr:ester cyclase [Thermomicrobiales bacterium]
MTQASVDVGNGTAIPDFIQAWATGWSTSSDPSLLLGTVTDDVVFEDVAIGDVLRGADALKALLGEVQTAVPDFTVAVQTAFATESMAAAEYVISGTQSGDLPYLAASGKSFSIRASSVFELDAGKIRRESRYYDAARFLSDLGGLNQATFDNFGTPASVPGGRA